MVTELRATPFPGHESELIGFIAQSADRIVIAFRGTKTGPEWLSDFRYNQVSWPYTSASGSVHSGFVSIYDSCREQILAALRTLPTTSSLLITGHSLGAALATYCALDLAVNTPHSQPILYTFGSPRAGSWLFARAHQKAVSHSMRIVVDGDIVPTQPLPVLLTTLPLPLILYSHIGQQIPLEVEGDNIKESHLLNTYLEGLNNLPEA